MNDGLVDREDLDRKQDTNLAPEEHLLVKPGDIAYNMMRMWQGAFGLADKEGIVSPAYVVLRPNKNVDPQYVTYLLRTPRMLYLMWAYSYGLTNDRLRLYFADFAAVKTNISPLSRQKRIALILGTWDSAIAVARSLIQNLLTQKRALATSLLTGQKRLLKNPKSWSKVRLHKLCEVRRGASPRPIDDPKWFSSKGRGWIRIADVTASRGRELVSTTQYLSENGVDRSVKVDPGDLVMSICASIGIPKKVGIPACIHDGFVVFRKCSPDLSLDFLYYYLEFVAPSLVSAGQPGTQKNLNTTIVERIEIPKISREEQEEIAEALRVSDELIHKARRSVDQLIVERTGLSKLLFSS